MKQSNEWLCRGSVLAAAFLMGGCAQSGSKYDFKSVSEQEMIALLLPTSVEITPFTRPMSFDKDKVPDGLEVHVRPLDQFGDPVKATGTMQFELHQFQPATGNHKGERIQFWEVQVATAKQVRQYWDRTSQMYQFQLGVDQIDAFVPNRKYILTVRYNSPQGEHLENDYTFDFQLRRDQLAEAER